MEKRDLSTELDELHAKFDSIMVHGLAGGGMVDIEMDGHMDVLAVHIEANILERKNVAMVETLVMSACNDAMNKVREAASITMGLSSNGGSGKDLRF
jgi:DNA-binding YbaB/EbfC family protein